MLTLIISILISICIVLVFRFLNKPYKPPLFGVYQQRNKFYWFKYVFIFVVLTLKQWYWRLLRAHAVDIGRSGDGTIHVHEDDAFLEKKHDLGDNPQANDSTFFLGISTDGADAVEIGIARRHGNICEALAKITLCGEEYLSLKLPDTYLEQDEIDKGEFTVQGIKIDHFIPMRTWKLSYHGKMKQKSNPEKTVNVQAELTWSALFAPFIYGNQMSPRCLASDLAREPWSSDYFRNIEKFGQVHYDQMGSLRGVVVVDDQKHVVTMPCFRDRSFGKRHEWRVFHRFVFHSLYLENGDCIVITCVSLPLICSHMTMGYVCRKSDQAVFAVQSCDFNLYQHGENQITPKDYGFSFKAGGKRYAVHVTVDNDGLYYMGQRDVKIYDHQLSVEVNRVKGRGLGQWMYNNVVKEQSSNDTNQSHKIILN